MTESEHLQNCNTCGVFLDGIQYVNDYKINSIPCFNLYVVAENFIFCLLNFISFINKLSSQSTTHSKKLAKSWQNERKMQFQTKSGFIPPTVALIDRLLEVAALALTTDISNHYFWPKVMSDPFGPFLERKMLKRLQMMKFSYRCSQCTNIMHNVKPPNTSVLLHQS